MWLENARQIETVKNSSQISAQVHAESTPVSHCESVNTITEDVLHSSVRLSLRNVYGSTTENREKLQLQLCVHIRSIHTGRLLQRH